MPSKGSSAQTQEINDLRERIEWLDGERRRLSKKLVELEQTIALQDRNREGREQRIQEMEHQLVAVSARISRYSNVDAQLVQFKEEIGQLIEQMDQRRVRADDEIDRLRRVEHEATARELADIRKPLSEISRLQNDMELRVAEETRLAKLLGEQLNRISSLENVVEAREQSYAYLEEREKQNSRNIGELQTALIESNKRLEPIRDQLERSAASASRLESGQQTLREEQDKMRESLKTWIEQVQIGEYERNQQIEKWRRELVEQDEEMENYRKEWIRFSDQYKEAKMAVQSLAEWQKQLQQQHREASELLRLETHRLQAIWDDYQQRMQSEWKNFTVETEQRWSTVNRRERQIEESIAALEELLKKLEQEKELIQRIQTAQADAIKRIPLMWMEEVEKAISQNPNRRRQPALIPVREE